MPKLVVIVFVPSSFKEITSLLVAMVGAVVFSYAYQMNEESLDLMLSEQPPQDSRESLS